MASGYFYFYTNYISRTIIVDNFDSDKNDWIIPQWLFEERKIFPISLPFSASNESFPKTFICKLMYFTNENCKFNVTWNSRKVIVSIKG